MSQSQSSRSGAIVLFIASLGALVVILASIALAVLAVLLAAINGRSTRITLRVLILLGLAGTGFAGLLLHQCWIGLAMVIGLLGLILDIMRPAGVNRPAHS